MSNGLSLTDGSLLKYVAKNSELVGISLSYPCKECNCFVNDPSGVAEASQTFDSNDDPNRAVQWA